MRSSGSLGEVTVDYNTSDNTAVSGSDYQLVSGTLTFMDGEISQTIEVPLLDNATYEGDETFTVALNNVQGGATIGTVSSAQVSITEDDPAPPSGVLQFSGVSFSTAENNASVIVTVMRVNGSFGDITVDYITADNTAVAGADYQPVSGTLTFMDSEISQTIEVPLLDDVTYEGDETFTVALSNVQGSATIGTLSSAQVSIIEDDPVPPSGVLQFSGVSYSVAENNTSVMVTVMRVNGSFGDVTVDYNTEDNTAVVGEDYQPVSGTLTFMDGEISQTIEVPLLDDATYEGDETFTVTLSNVQGGVVLGLPEGAFITINEDDSKPESIVIDAPSASTSGGGGGSVGLFGLSLFGLLGLFRRKA
jgi:microcystin-dependent protein